MTALHPDTLFNLGIPAFAVLLMLWALGIVVASIKAKRDDDPSELDSGVR